MTGWMKRSQPNLVDGIVVLRTWNSQTGTSSIVRAQDSGVTVKTLLAKSEVVLRDRAKNTDLARAPIESDGGFRLSVPSAIWRSLQVGVLLVRSGGREATLLFDVEIAPGRGQGLVAVVIDTAPGEGSLPARLLFGQLVDQFGASVTHRPRGITTDLPVVWVKALNPEQEDIGTEPWTQVDERGMFLLTLPDDEIGIIDEVTLEVATSDGLMGDKVALNFDATPIETSALLTWVRVIVPNGPRLNEFAVLAAAHVDENTGGYAMASWWPDLTAAEIRALPWTRLRRTGRSRGLPPEVVAVVWQASLADTRATEVGIPFPMGGIDDPSPSFSRLEVLYGVLRVRGRTDRQAWRLSLDGLRAAIKTAVEQRYIDPQFGDVEDSWGPAAVRCLNVLRTFFDALGDGDTPHFSDLGAALRESYETELGDEFDPHPWVLCVWVIHTWLEQASDEIRSAWRSGEVPGPPEQLWTQVRTILAGNSTLATALTALLGTTPHATLDALLDWLVARMRSATELFSVCGGSLGTWQALWGLPSEEAPGPDVGWSWPTLRDALVDLPLDQIPPRDWSRLPVVVGATEDEVKRRVWSTAVFARVELSWPLRVLAARAAEADGESSGVVAALLALGGAVRRLEDVTDGVLDALLIDGAPVSPPVRARIRALQALMPITPPLLRYAIARGSELAAGVDLDTSTGLLAPATSVAAMGRGTFLGDETSGAIFKIGRAITSSWGLGITDLAEGEWNVARRIARWVYERAAAIAASVLMLSRRGADAAGPLSQWTTHLEQSAPMGLGDWCQCDGCGSITSASAWMFDLLKFLDGHGWLDDIRWLPGGHDLANERRLDIVRLQVDCNNLDVPMPYIDLANEMLERYILIESETTPPDLPVRTEGDAALRRLEPQFTDQQAEVDVLLAEAVHPFPLPMDLPGRTLRAWLDREGVDHAAMLLAWGRWGSTSPPVDLPPGRALQVLAGIPWKEVELLGGSTSVDAAAWYGVAEIGELRRVSMFMKRLGATEAEVRELVDSIYSNPDLLLGIGLEPAVEGAEITGCNIEELVLSRRARCAVEVELEDDEHASVRIDATRYWDGRLIEIEAKTGGSAIDIEPGEHFVIIDDEDTQVVGSLPTGAIVICRITFTTGAIAFDQDGPSEEWLLSAAAIVRAARRTGMTVSQAARLVGVVTPDAWAEMEITRLRYGWTHAQMLLGLEGVDAYGAYKDGLLTSDWEARFQSVTRISPMEPALDLAPDRQHLVVEVPLLVGEEPPLSIPIEGYIGSVLAGADLKVREWEPLRAFIKAGELGPADEPWMSGALTFASVQSLVRLKQTALALKMSPVDLVKWRQFTWPTWKATVDSETSRSDRWPVVDRTGVRDELLRDLRSTGSALDQLVWLGTGRDESGVHEPTDDQMISLLTTWRDALLAGARPALIEAHSVIRANKGLPVNDAATLPGVNGLIERLNNEATRAEAQEDLKDRYVLPLLTSDTYITALPGHWAELEVAFIGFGELVSNLLDDQGVAESDLLWGPNIESVPATKDAWVDWVVALPAADRALKVIDLVATLWARKQLRGAEAWLQTPMAMPSLVDLIVEVWSRFGVEDARPHAETLVRVATRPMLFQAPTAEFGWRPAGTVVSPPRKDPEGLTFDRLIAIHAAFAAEDGRVAKVWEALEAADHGPLIGSSWPYLDTASDAPLPLPLRLWRWTAVDADPEAVYSLGLLTSRTESPQLRMDALASLTLRTALAYRTADLVGAWVGLSSDDTWTALELLAPRCPAVQDEVAAVVEEPLARALHSVHDLLHDSFLGLRSTFRNLDLGGTPESLPVVGFDLDELPWLRTMLVRVKKVAALVNDVGVDLTTLRWSQDLASRSWAEALPLPVTADTLCAPDPTGVSGLEGDDSGDGLVLLALVPVLEGRLLKIGSIGSAPPMVSSLIETILTSEPTEPAGPEEPENQAAWTAALSQRFGLTEDERAALFGTAGLDLNTAIDDLSTHAAIRLLRRIDCLVREARRLSMPFPVLRHLGRGDLSTDQVKQVRAAIAASHAGPAWADVATPVEDGLRKLRRDAYVAWLTGTGRRWENDPGKLAGDALFDPGMNPDVATSRLLFATAAVQRFVQRVQLNLEPVTKPWTAEAEEKWVWMKQYRVWEAARKVFFYPENWLDPELLTNKTPLFEDLSDALQGDAISGEQIEAAYFQYLDGLVQVANLEIVSHLTADVDGETCRYVLGRTKMASPTYWIRRRRQTRVWTPWKRVDIDAGTNATTLFFDGRRLMIVWASVEPFVRAGEDVPSGITVRPFVATLGGAGWMPGQPVGEATIPGGFRTDNLLIDNAAAASLLAVPSEMPFVSSTATYVGPRIVVYARNFFPSAGAPVLLPVGAVATQCELFHLVPDSCSGGWAISGPEPLEGLVPSFGIEAVTGVEVARFTEPVGGGRRAGSLQLDENRIRSSGSRERPVYRVVGSTAGGPNQYALLNATIGALGTPFVHVKLLEGDSNNAPLDFAATFSVEGRARTVAWSVLAAGLGTAYSAGMPMFGKLHFYADPKRTYAVEAEFVNPFAHNPQVPNATPPTSTPTPPADTATPVFPDGPDEDEKPNDGKDSGKTSSSTLAYHGNLASLIETVTAARGS